MNALWRRSAQELATLIADKQVSAVEVIEAHLVRIDAVNPKLNAIVRVLADEARTAAAEADRTVASGAALGPLHGVPFTVKENIDMAGLPTTWAYWGALTWAPEFFTAVFFRPMQMLDPSQAGRNDNPGRLT